MPPSVAVAYALVSPRKSRYAVMACLSILALRRLYRSARITLLVDPATPPTLAAHYPELPGIVDDVITIPDATMDHLPTRSFYLKMRSRDVLQGDFAYLDSDTLPVRPFAEVFERDWDIALVQDRNHHCPITPCYPHWEIERLRKTGWDNPIPKYFNAGIVFLRDNAAARRVVADWQARWRVLYGLGDGWDQLPLNCAIHTCAVNVLELPPAYNAMVLTHPVHARRAKIYHYYASACTTFGDSLFEHLIRHYETTRAVDWQAVDRCVAMDHPWMPPYWPRRLWQTGNPLRAIRERLFGGRRPMRGRASEAASGSTAADRMIPNRSRVTTCFPS